MTRQMLKFGWMLGPLDAFRSYLSTFRNNAASDPALFLGNPLIRHGADHLHAIVSPFGARLLRRILGKPPDHAMGANL